MTRKFTIDMFDRCIPSWERLFEHYKGKPITYLEVGSYEGASLCWMLDNILTHEDARAIAIDSWAVTPDWKEHTQEMWDAVFKRFVANVGDNHRVRARCGKSVVGVAELVAYVDDIDIAYIDGSHRGLDCLTDMVMAWTVIKPGGIMVVDDVEGWRRPDDWPERDHPKMACLAFTAISGFAPEPAGDQFVFRKGGANVPG